MKDSRDIAPIKATTAVLFAFLMVAVGGTTNITTDVSAQTTDRTFESQKDGFRLQIPQGWVIQDENIPSDPNIETIAILCLQNEALPAVGGGHNCIAGKLTDFISIDRWSDLRSRPEFENISSSNYTITTDDLLALRIQYIYNNGSATGIKIENSTDVDEFTKLVNMTYTRHDQVNIFVPVDVDRKSLQMYVLSQDRNTGYDIVNNLNNTQTQQHSSAVQEVFNSFELL
jgi:hypothetical protein